MLVAESSEQQQFVEFIRFASKEPECAFRKINILVNDAVLNHVDQLIHDLKQVSYLLYTYRL